MKTSQLHLVITAILMAGHSYGAVVLQDTYAAAGPGGAPTDLGGGVFGYEINLNPLTEFSAAGHGKLVMVLSLHDGAAGLPPATPTIASVTYNGLALTQVVYAIDNSPLVGAGIFYLDNVAADGTLRIELSAGNVQNYGFGLYALDGLKPGVQDTGTGRLASELSASGSAGVTITTDGGFFVQETARNNQTLDGSVDDYQDLYDYSTNSYRGLSQYQVTATAGDYFAPINNTGENFRIVVTAGFEAIPEPSSTALLGLGGLALILRRRRRWNAIAFHADDPISPLAGGRA